MELQMRNAKKKLPKGIRKSEQKLTKMMLLIFGVFMLSYLPGVGVKIVSGNEVWKELQKAPSKLAY